ncbi:helix-turn-helix domain-containing protein [Companilactobacillus furfuricola]|uniref:helix-turn-helix domain-containing protein n=1 Tax=Companilactobacillus furfuricola TaxID=1462575 RepID=UPI000F7A0279|nr:helix-turn-helix transcriptional regulator [Companilactobacillus furfuricola]
MTEEKYAEAAYEVESSIKIALLKNHMTQRELADEIDANPQQLNRAIKGDMTPKSRELRKQIEKVLGI